MLVAGPAPAGSFLAESRNERVTGVRQPLGEIQNEVGESAAHNLDFRLLRIFGCRSGPRQSEPPGGRRLFNRTVGPDYQALPGGSRKGCDSWSGLAGGSR